MFVCGGLSIQLVPTQQLGCHSHEELISFEKMFWYPRIQIVDYIINRKL